MGKYLDKTGLQYFYGKLKEKFADKTDIPAVPEINNPKVSIKMNGAEKGSFTLNQATAGEVDLGTVLTEHQDISGKVDKTSLTPVLQEIDFTYAETDAGRKAQLDKFAADWKVLTGASNLAGARFVGIFDVEDPYDGVFRNVAGIMTYCAGDGTSDVSDNSFYGVCNGYSFSRQKSNIAIKVSLTDGSLIATPLFSHLEAITIYTDNTAEHKKANLDNIVAYEANLQALGADVSKGFSFLANAGEYVMTFMKSRNGNHQFFAIQTYNNENYITFIDTDGTYTESPFSAIYANRAYAESTYLKKSDSITEVKMNGVSKGTSGVVDLGTVLTEHQSLKTINGEAITGSGDITIKGDVTKCRINANTLVAEPTGNEPMIFKMPLADVQKYKNYDVIEIYSVENGVETVMYTVYHGAFSEFYATSNGTGWLTGIFIGDETTTDENKIGFELIMSETVDTVDKDAKEPISSSAVYNALQAKQDKLTIDASMSDTSTNPVQNKVIKAYIDGLVGNVAAQLAQI